MRERRQQQSGSAADKLKPPSMLNVILCFDSCFENRDIWNMGYGMVWDVSFYVAIDISSAAAGSSPPAQTE